MKLLFDQNLSHRLLSQLSQEFPNSQHVRDVGMASAHDIDIWAYAAANGLAVVSKDVDFQQRSLVLGHPPKVIWVRLGNCTTTAVADLLKSRLAEIQAFENDPAGSFLALS